MNQADLPRVQFTPEEQLTHADAIRVGVTYESVDRLLRDSIDFNNDTSDTKGRYLLGELYHFADAMSTIEGCEGVFATGYPFYALKSDNSVVAVPEIERFISETRDKLQSDRMREFGKWICTACQVRNHLPDLKTECKPCVDVDLRPRDVLKALPDLDFWVVVEDDHPDVIEEIEKSAHAAGFYQSDDSIYRALRDTSRVVTALKNREEPDARLPIDLHVVTKAELEEALDKIFVMYEGQTAVAPIPIRPLSLHVDWEMADEPYDFTKDFLLSMTEHGITDEDLQSKIFNARQAVVENLTNDQIAASIISLHPKEKRQLKAPELRQVLETRLNEWRDKS